MSSILIREMNNGKFPVHFEVECAASDKSLRLTILVLTT